MAISAVDRNRTWRARCKERGFRQVVLTVPDDDRELFLFLGREAKRRAEQGEAALAVVLADTVEALTQRPGPAPGPSLPHLRDPQGMGAGRRPAVQQEPIALLGAKRPHRPLPTDY